MYLLRRNIKIKRLSSKLDHTKLGLFRIKRVKGPLIVKLELLKDTKIYPVFYKSLLESVPKNARLVRSVRINEELKDLEYKVQEVLA